MIKVKISKDFNYTKLTKEGFVIAIIGHSEQMSLFTSDLLPLTISTINIQYHPNFIIRISIPKINEVFYENDTKIPTVEHGGFIIKDLDSSDYDKILAKCLRDKSMYMYYRQGQYLCKIPRNMKPYVIDKLYSIHDLYVMYALYNSGLVFDCIRRFMRYFIGLKVNDFDNYKELEYNLGNCLRCNKYIKCHQNTKQISWSRNIDNNRDWGFICDQCDKLSKMNLY